MSEVAQTTKEVIEVVTTALQPLAEKLGTTAQYVWGLQVKQAYVDGFVAIGGLGLGIGLCILAFTLMHYLTKDGKCDKADSFFISAFIFILGAGFVLMNFSNTLNCFINPEYYALQQMIKMVK